MIFVEKSLKMENVLRILVYYLNMQISSLYAILGVISSFDKPNLRISLTFLNIEMKIYGSL
jgi:hypothetical protein